MEKNIPIYNLEITSDLEDDVEVDVVSLVDRPAIERQFLLFKDEKFINPSKGEHKEEFLPRCISYVINEGKESEQAVAICNSIWDEHFANEKISFDFDDTLSTQRGQELALSKIKAGAVVYIISARNSTDGMFTIADELGIPHSRVYATGSNKAKVEKIKELGISKHYDNNSDVIAELGGIGEKFQFSKQNFAIQNEEERIISGPLMLADTPIYRNDDNGEYYVVFTKETIKKIAQRFFKKGYQSNVNLMHEQGNLTEGMTMFESWIKDEKRGIKAMKGFEDVPDGSWFGSFKVDNDEVWQMVKDGKVRGFSVEGQFNYRKTGDKKIEQLWANVLDVLAQIG